MSVFLFWWKSSGRVWPFLTVIGVVSVLLDVFSKSLESCFFTVWAARFLGALCAANNFAHSCARNVPKTWVHF